MTFYRINTPRVIHETLDDEVIAIDFDSGTYYHITGSGALIWSLIDQQIDIEDILSAVHDRYQDGELVIAESVRAFVAGLLQEGLISELTHTGVSHATTTTDSPEKIAFVPPTLTRFTDMQQLLLLDPVHDVDEDAGWPIRRS